jgi:hypothetical protein
MKHIQDYQTYNESVKDYLVAGAIAASTAFSSPKEVKATEKDKIEYAKSKEVEVKFKPVDTISYDYGFDGIYDIIHSDNISDVIIYNSADKLNRKRGESPETNISTDENTIKLILKTTIKDNQYPVDFKLIPKSMSGSSAWSTPDNFTKAYMIQLEFEKDTNREESEIFTEITISNLRKGRYSFNIGGNIIRFEVK